MAEGLDGGSPKDSFAIYTDWRASSGERGLPDELTIAVDKMPVEVIESLRAHIQHHRP